MNVAAHGKFRRPEPPPPEPSPKNVVLLPPGSEALAAAVAKVDPGAEAPLDPLAFGLEMRLFNGFACLFLLVWCGFWYGATITGAVASLRGGEGVGNLLFLSLFWLVGLVPLYLLVWMLFGREWLFFEPNRLRRCRKLFFWRKTATLERAKVEAVVRRSGRTKNGRWHSLEVAGPNDSAKVELVGRTSDEKLCHWVADQVSAWSGKSLTDVRES